MSEKIKEPEKIKPREIVRETYQPRKEEPSKFDRILEQNKLLQRSPDNLQQMTQKSSQEQTRVQGQEERGERGRDKDKDEREQNRGKEKAREERQTGADSGQKIVGRGRRDGEGGGRGKGQGFGGSTQKRQITDSKKLTTAKVGQSVVETSKFASEMAAKLKTAHLSPEFVQKLVNQIIRSVSSGINKEGDKEVRLDLQDRIFKGLQLRVALKSGKVNVQFRTMSQETRELFTASADSIKKELEAKGISVGDIKVT